MKCKGKILMRMRYKKHLPERLNNVVEMFLARESEEFYKTPLEERHFVVDIAAAFGNDNPVVLEIGCGKGAYAVKCAKLHTETNYIAVEKLSNVIVAGCELAQKEQLKNLLFLNCGAENLLYFLPQNCVSEIVLNFSCPFPKKGYANRRLTHKNFLDKYRLLLKDNGIIHQKTDDRAFFEFSLEQYNSCGFEVKNITYDLHSEKNRENITTEYEEKFLAEGKKICACDAIMLQTKQ